MVHLSTYVVPAVPVKLLVALVGVVMLPPDPDTMLQAPVPIVGVLPASVVLVSPHIEAPVWSDPALAVVGFRWNVIVTSSDDAVHGELLIVHLSTYVVPAVPLKVLVALVGVVMLPPVPDTMLQAPVPIVGVLPASVVLVSPHIGAPVWSDPALAVVGFCWKVIVTSSVDAVHGGLLMVHLSTYVVPAVPVKALVALVGVVMLPPAPDTMLQAPVPIVGVLPASVVLVSPHIGAPIWSDPALAVVAF